ncbi:MAG: LysM peptidoglycan-binding domain-containing protein, partial [Gammaproteobacteria bacterium]
MKRLTVLVGRLILCVPLLICAQHVQAGCVSGIPSKTCVSRISTDQEISMVEISRWSAAKLVPEIGYHNNDVKILLERMLDDMGSRYKLLGFIVDSNDQQKKVSDCRIYPVSSNGRLDKSVTDLGYLASGDCTNIADTLRLIIRRSVVKGTRWSSIDIKSYDFANYPGNAFQNSRSNMYVGSAGSSTYAHFEAYTLKAIDEVGDVPKGIPVTAYIAKKGDSLWSVAKATVGTGAAWPAFYDLNAATLESPTMLSEGDTIYLPRNISGWQEVTFHSVNARSVSMEIYGTSDYELLVETLCRPRP